MKENIKVYPHKGEEFVGLCMSVPCETCNHGVKDNLYDISVTPYDSRKEEHKITLCKDCMEKLHEEIGRALHKTIKEGDTVYELTLCDDGVWRIFPMVVKNVCIYGSVRWIKDKEPTVWNIYAESDDTYMYKNFYEEGKSWFFNKSDALAALKEKTEKQ